MRAVVCNKCKKVITDEKIVKDTLRLDFCTEKVGKYAEKHLCDECKEELYKFLGEK